MSLSLQVTCHFYGTSSWLLAWSPFFKALWELGALDDLYKQWSYHPYKPWWVTVDSTRLIEVSFWKEITIIRQRMWSERPERPQVKSDSKWVSRHHYFQVRDAYIWNLPALGVASTMPLPWCTWQYNLKLWICAQSLTVSPFIVFLKFSLDTLWSMFWLHRVPIIQYLGLIAQQRSICVFPRPFI